MAENLLKSAFTKRGLGERGYTVFSFESVSSTMDLCGDLFNDWKHSKPFRHAPLVGSQTFSKRPFQVIVNADTQTAGRGRLQRPWISASKTGIYQTVGRSLEVPGGLPSLMPLPLAIGVGISSWLIQLGANCELKWPNDIVIRERNSPRWRKVAGILVESSMMGNGIAMNIGFGINLGENAALKDVQGTSLSEHLAVLPEREEMIAEAAHVVDQTLSKFLSNGFAPFLPAIRERFVLTGCTVRVTGNSGGEGIVTGVTDDGALRLQKGSNETTIRSGELEVVDVPRS